MTVDKRIISATLMRRQVLGLLAVSAFGRVAGAHETEPRIAAVDWAMLETVMTLGITPVAATELLQFRSGAVEPLIPDSVFDLGLRGAPNFELLYLLKPELILISPFYTRYQQRLEAIAPCVSLPFYVKGEPPFGKAMNAVTALGERLDRTRQAEEVLETAARNITTMRQKLATLAARPTYIINIGDARHFRAFGADSMFGDMLSRLGLENAWKDQSRFTFAAPVPIENLAGDPDARIVIVSDIPVEARSGLRNSVIWNSLAPVKAGRVVMIGNVNAYGGITAGMRFARLLTEALTANGDAL